MKIHGMIKLCVLKYESICVTFLKCFFEKDVFRMHENKKIFLSLFLLMITYINFCVTADFDSNRSNGNTLSQTKPIEKDLDFSVSPQPLLPPGIPFEPNHNCSCDQDVLVYNDRLDTCHCQTEKTCVCETCTYQPDPCKNMFKKHQ